MEKNLYLFQFLAFRCYRDHTTRCPIPAPIFWIEVLCLLKAAKEEIWVSNKKLSFFKLKSIFLRMIKFNEINVLVFFKQIECFGEKTFKKFWKTTGVWENDLFIRISLILLRKTCFFCVEKKKVEYNYLKLYKKVAVEGFGPTTCGILKRGANTSLYQTSHLLFCNTRSASNGQFQEKEKTPLLHLVFDWN